MRTTIELPAELLLEAKRKASSCNMSLKEFFILAVREKIAHRPAKARLEIPVIGGPTSAWTLERPFLTNADYVRLDTDEYLLG